MSEVTAGSVHDKSETSDDERASMHKDEVRQDTVAVPAEPEYPSMKKATVIMIVLYLAIFLVCLDQTILATAIPRITDEFHSINDIGWYGSAYVLTNSAFQLIMGRIYKHYSPKWVFLVEIVIFEVGSAISGAAPNSTVFIIGRAISGLGSAGIMSGLVTIMFMTVPLQKRPMFQGLFGAVFGVASVVGPLLGGVFTDKLTWRWCFYINLPVGAVTLVVIALILHLPDDAVKASKLSWKEQLLQLDPVGNLCLLPAIISLLLALQWGGTIYAWSNARIVVLFVLFGLLIIGFAGVQLWKQEKATLPPRIIKNRSIWAGMAYGFCSGGAMMVIIYYLPLYFQAIKGVSAVQSGIRTIPLVLSLVVGAIGSGAAVSRLGYYTPFMVVSTIIMSIGAGLLSTFQVNSSHAIWIGYQVVFGFGLGLGMQQPMNAAQTVLGKQDIAIGAAAMFFTRLLGGAIFLSVAENLFTNRLISNLSKLADLDASVVVSAGATGLRNSVPSSDLASVLVGYNDALRQAFYLGTGLACATTFGALFMEWKSVKKASSITPAKLTNDPKICTVEKVESV